MPIFDQGYQHWAGALSGHAWRWLTITRQGVRTGFKNRYLRMVLLLAWLPALALVAMLCVWGLVERNSDLVISLMSLLRNVFGPQSVADPKHYRLEVWTICFHYFLQAELRFSLLLILMVGPNLISADMRFNALPLYFSRPLRRIDYFLGKLGIIVAFIGLIVIVPSIIAYILGLLFSLDITIVKDTYSVLLASVAYGLVIALSAGLLILALSSLSRNSRYVALFWVAILLIGGIVATVLEGVEQHQRIRTLNANIGSSQNDETRIAIETEAFKNDWRPAVSYVSNLSRIGEQLLGTNRCWETLYQWMPVNDRLRFLYTKLLGPQFPWTWSAAVLLGLFGLSACILNLQIKSLDRLK
jgi:ABC-2 type transport system permease protein